MKKCLLISLVVDGSGGEILINPSLIAQILFLPYTENKKIIYYTIEIRFAGNLPSVYLFDYIEKGKSKRFITLKDAKAYIGDKLGWDFISKS